MALRGILGGSWEILSVADPDFRFYLKDFEGFFEGFLGFSVVSEDPAGFSTGFFLVIGRLQGSLEVPGRFGLGIWSRF